ncbi:DNA repair protein RadA [Criblamydia sequanensis]|uniref:DNA repair protein RadA n=1 Tax=Candidatus Criblamydia sequanensis CRIB-18 TaxID=1437425 RepID=A0A090D009_9BACT|nr:DNA repair protein RadA [Criblamydia sequanensis]CDR32868.1 DNA repair protein radA [Criblamydia sequanensis CRIB-18]
MAVKIKSKIIFSCSDCGATQNKWSGQCSTCHNWNTLKEEVELVNPVNRFLTEVPKSKPVTLKEVDPKEVHRIQTNVQELDRLFGGGVTLASLTLIGGDPGIGKSTLLLQLSNIMAKKPLKVLYVSGEESVDQIAMRARRLNVDSENLFLLAETNYNQIVTHVQTLNPDVLIIDSIQVIYKTDVASSPGSPTQIRETASDLMHLSKGRGMTTFIIGHVTKGGEIAGPKLLEHLVDTVLYFEGDKQQNLRIIRVVKNRFGPTDEIAVFQMLKGGLAEVSCPSKLFLEERILKSPGSVVSSAMEGTRTILLEVQALVTETAFATPSRRFSGLDNNRVSLLLAVLEKKLKLPLFKCDVFASVAGGMKVFEPALDLALILAIAASFKNKAIDSSTLVAGEVGLAGEVRAIQRIESRVKEAIQMGFKKMIIPKRNVKGVSQDNQKGITLVGVETLDEAIQAAFN